MALPNVPQHVQRISPRNLTQASRGYIPMVAFSSVQCRPQSGCRMLCLPPLGCTNRKLVTIDKGTTLQAERFLIREDVFESHALRDAVRDTN